MALQRRLVVYGRLPRDGPEMDTLLRGRGFQVYAVDTEQELLDALEFGQPDAVVLLATREAPILCGLVPVAAARTPVFVVWPGMAVNDGVAVLDAGADYVTSSFQPDLLAAQIRANLRHSRMERNAPGTIELGYLRIDLQQRQVTVDGRVVPLTRTEFDVLRVLAERPGTVLPSGEIMQHVMGIRIADPEAQDLLKVHIHRLRQKLERDSDNPRFIRTVRGHGYMYAFERRARDRTAQPG